ncbi:MAG: YraN family protein [Brevinematales bacterium]|nr:YraN family protein [Brevinematales bacterium]
MKSSRDPKNPSPNRFLLGRWAEEKACQYLQNQGCIILARNYRTVHGEIDIIALEKETLVLIEVKCRKFHQRQWCDVAISPQKIKRILKTAEIYIEENEIVFQEMRVDVIWLIRNQNSVELRHQREFV